MKTRFATLVVLTVSWGLFALAVLWPVAALLVACFAENQPPPDGFTFSSRQLGLFGRSVWLSGCAAILAILVSLPAAFVLGRFHRAWSRPLWVGVLFAILLTPPMICAFGWQRVEAWFDRPNVAVLSATSSSRPPPPSAPIGRFDRAVSGKPSASTLYVRCVGVWAFWTWPIPALMIAAGWSRGGRSMYEAAIMSTSSWSAFLRAVGPVFARYVGVSAAVVFLLCFGDYGVPHACGLMVYATELLGRAQSSNRLLDAAWSSLPAVSVAGITLALVWIPARRSITDFVPSESTALCANTHRWVGPFVVLFCVTVSWLIPVGVLYSAYASRRVMSIALATYSHDLMWSLALSVAAGVAVIAMGLGLTLSRRLWKPALMLTLVWGTVPGSLVGAALVASYNHDATWWLYDDWPIFLLALITRFAWVGLLLGTLLRQWFTSSVVAQARTDGAGDVSIMGRLVISGNWPTLVAGVGIVAALSLGEVPTASMVRVPRFSPISLLLIEKYHRFEYGMLASMSLWLVVVALVPAAVLSWMLGRWRRRRT